MKNLYQTDVSSTKILKQMSNMLEDYLTVDALYVRTANRILNKKTIPYLSKFIVLTCDAAVLRIVHFQAYPIFMCLLPAFLFVDQSWNI